MKLTGKCREAFEKWFLDNYGFDKWEDVKPDFHNIDTSMQYGVYVDFFDSVGIRIMIQGGEGGLFYIKINYNCEISRDIPRHEARTKAISKANEIYNEK